MAYIVVKRMKEGVMSRFARSSWQSSILQKINLTLQKFSYFSFYNDIFEPKHLFHNFLRKKEVDSNLQK